MQKHITLAFVSSLVSIIKSSGVTDGIAQNIVAEKLGFVNYAACQAAYAKQEAKAASRVDGYSVPLDHHFGEIRPFTLAMEVRAPEHEFGEHPDWAFVSITTGILQELLELRRSLLLTNVESLTVLPHSVGLGGPTFPLTSLEGGYFNLNWSKAVINANGVELVGYPKHSDVRCKTTELTFQTLDEALKSRTPGDGSLDMMWLTQDFLVTSRTLDSATPSDLLESLLTAIGGVESRSLLEKSLAEVEIEETDENAAILKLLPSIAEMDALTAAIR